MDKNNVLQLKNLLGTLASAKIITQDDIEQILKGVLSIMVSFKKGNETLNAETTETVTKLLAQIQEDKKTITTEFKDKMSEIKILIKNIETIEPLDGIDGKDGLDADEEYIIQELAKLIPQYEKTELDTGRQIIEKINKEKEIKIDASQIKNLPKFTREIIQERGARGGGYETPLVDSTGRPIPKNAQGAYIIPSSTPSSANIVFGEVVAGDTNTFTLAHTPTGTISLAANGQVLTLAVDFTISGAIITTLSPWSAGTVIANYQY